jgi:hypothetical protein
MSDLKELLSNCSLNNPASDKTIKKLEQKLGKKLPESYKNLLKFSNGLEGPIGKNSYIVFWRTEEIIPLNKAFKVEELVPGMLLIGSDGGEEAVGIDFRENNKTKGNYYMTPYISNGWEDAVDLGKTIEELVTSWLKQTEKTKNNNHSTEKENLVSEIKEWVGQIKKGASIQNRQ